MLTHVAAYSSWQSAPILPLSELGAQTDPIQIRNIEGLGPVDATVNTTPYGSMDGESYAGSGVLSRNIVLTLGLNPDWNTWTMERLRRLLYRYFIPKQPTKLVFHSDDEFPTVEITGIVESVDPTLFTKDVEIQVSIVCPDPYFRATDPVVISGVNTDDPLEIDYVGSVEVGINVKVTHAANPLPNDIRVQIGDLSETYFRVWTDVQPTKYFLMNSVPGNKYIQRIDLTTGVITNLLYRKIQGSTWPVLKPGLNDFQIITNGGVQDWVLTYVPKFGGL